MHTAGDRIAHTCLINVCHLPHLGNAAGQVGAAVDRRAHRGLVGSDLRAGGAAPVFACPRVTLLVVVPSAHGQLHQRLDSRRLPERLRPQPDPRGPRLRRSDRRGGRRRHSPRPGVDAAAIGVVHVANAFGELFARQGHLGAMPATVHDGLWDTPSSRHEAACASGSVATLAAIADLRSGAYDTALVVGVELEKTVPGDTAAEHLGAAAWIGHEGADARFMWPHMFAQRRRRVRPALRPRRDATCAPSPQLNFANARSQPQRADPRLDGARPADRRRRLDDEVNPVIEGRLRRFDCSQMTDGGAGVVLVTDDYLRDHPDARPIGRIDGWGHRTVGLGLQQKLDRSADDPYVLPHVRGAVLDAFDRAQRHPRRRRRLRGARLLHAERVPRHRPHRADRSRRIVEGHRERRDRDRRARCRSTPAAGSSAAGTPSAPPACGCCSTPPNRSATAPATIRSRAQRRSAR